MSIALKFTSLFVRTLAKPIASTIKNHAKDHPRFRKACIGFAQGLHKAEYSLRLKLLNQNNKIKPLNDSRAIQSGANFVAESFVFSVAGSMIFYESYRSRRKEQKRQESVADDIRILQDEISWMKQKLEQSTIIRPGEHVDLPRELRPLILKASSSEDGDGRQSQEQQNRDQAKPQNISQNQLGNQDLQQVKLSPSTPFDSKKGEVSDR